jgi:hypothetical protein
VNKFLVDADIARSPKIGALAEILKIHRLLALGHFISFLSGVAEHAERGNLSGVPASTIETWAEWAGKRHPNGAFVKALRKAKLIDADGEVVGWKERNERWLRERDRVKAFRDRTRTERVACADSTAADTGGPRTENRTEGELHPVTEPKISIRDGAAATSGSAHKNPPLGSVGPVSASVGNARFPSDYFENDALRANCEKNVREHLGTGLERYGAGVVQEIMNTAASKKNRRAYATKLCTNRDWLRKVARRIAAEAPPEAKAAAPPTHAKPPGVPASGSIGELLPSVMAGLGVRA